MDLLLIYNKLLDSYGKQGWWPLQDKYSGVQPRNEQEILEICIGAILTQNTSWKNVEVSLKQLEFTRKYFDSVSDEKLRQLIKSSGYYNQKTRKIREFLKLKEITRESLLSTWGIGKETTDSILLYAYNKPYFVIDAYTKRIFERLGFKFNDYDSLQEIFYKNLEKDAGLFKEYHALLVEHCKQHCLKKPKCENCPLLDICSFTQKTF